MDNSQIASIFRRIAEMLELKDENPFKIRSYRLAADTIEDHHEPVADLAARGLKELQTIPGIGKNIGTYIIELVESGTCSAYEQIKKEVPESALDILRVDGIGMKTAQRLFRDYQIASLNQLEAFAATGRLQTLAGLGSKTVKRILRSIEQLKTEVRDEQ
jgi:DNA polymerase (family X)